MIKEVIHIGITVSDLDRSINFYENILGLRLKGKMVMEGEATDILFGLKNSRVKIAYLNGSDNLVSPPLELLQFTSTPCQPDKASLHKTSISEICFKVEDIDRTYEELARQGVEFISKPQFFDFTDQGFGKSKAVYFKDPDGIILELIEPILESGPSCKD